MTSQLLAERQQAVPDDAGQVAKVKVLVAKKPLSPGTVFKTPEEDFQEKQFEKGQEPANALTDVNQLRGERLKRPLRIGDYVSKDDLVDKNSAGIGEDLPKGMRAIGLPVNQLVSASGFASLPGSHVDILWTMRGNTPETNFTKVLLENVKILAADTNERKPEDKNWVIASVVTVALSVEDALLASIAMDTGKVSFLLRSSTDDQASDVQKVSLTQVIRDRGKKETDEGDIPDSPSGKGGSRGSVDSIPDVPGAERRTEAAPPEIAPPKTHTLTIHNGQTPIRTKYVMDKEGKEVISTDVSETERVRPTVQQPPAVTGQQPQPQAPAGGPSQPQAPASSPNGKGQ
jgi:pilus assembly protein CpaB